MFLSVTHTHTHNICIIIKRDIFKRPRFRECNVEFSKKSMNNVWRRFEKSNEQIYLFFFLYIDNRTKAFWNRTITTKMNNNNVICYSYGLKKYYIYEMWTTTSVWAGGKRISSHTHMPEAIAMIVDAKCSTFETEKHIDNLPKYSARQFVYLAALIE